jgi:hypothetical protein
VLGFPTLKYSQRIKFGLAVEDVKEQLQYDPVLPGTDTIPYLTPPQGNLSGDAKAP